MSIVLKDLSFEPFEFYCDKVMSVRALQLYGVSLPPGHAPAELESLKVREDVVIEESAKLCGIVTAYLEALANFVASTAFSLNIRNICYYLIAHSWIFGHILAACIKYAFSSIKKLIALFSLYCTYLVLT